MLTSGLSQLQAFWIDRTSAAIQHRYLNMGWSYWLVSSSSADLGITVQGTLTDAICIPLTPSAEGLSPTQVRRFPQLSSYVILRLPADVDPLVLQQALKGQIGIAATDPNGQIRYLTGVQHAGVLDDLFYFPGQLGLIFGRGEDAEITLRIWAPTAQSVNVLLYDFADQPHPSATIAMSESNDVWTAWLDYSWRGKYYLFQLRVYAPSLQALVNNIVTDPYSVDLSLNGAKSRITDLRDGSTKPDGWDIHHSPHLRAINDLTIYELHIREFSSNDTSVREDHRGTYLAFTNPATNGMRHLQLLAKAGIRAVHLLPSFHFASVDEDKSTWKSPGDLSGYPPDSEMQQALVSAIKDQDGYNWGYDPVHYMSPEGSYAYDAGARVREYREMVLALHQAGLRVVQDLVFNHAFASGQAASSVLDKMVPAYYHRLDPDGNVLSSTCCSDTASEHRMMEKLIIDGIVQSAREYRIDGFRFDLMGFHFVSNLRKIQHALSQLTLEDDGVDGSKIYLYGEGWQAADTAYNVFDPNATQLNLHGTGIGTFNDRIRDGIRGGTPFSDPRLQGFATGLFTRSNTFTNQTERSSAQLSTLLEQADWIRAGLAGNMRDFTFIDRFGQAAAASALRYNRQPVGYTASPIETVNFCSVHDNRILFDAIQLKSAANSENGDSIEIRTRRQVLALSLIALGQGVPFFAAGDEILRSKDMDNNSYNSGDWFNRLDFTYESNNWGTGLPLASENQSAWPLMKPLLADPVLKPDRRQILHCRDAFLEFLRIRASSLLFRMSTLQEIQQNLRFLNTGPRQTPGLIVIQLHSNSGNYGVYRHILVLFNADVRSVRFQHETLKGLALRLHPEQQRSQDPLTRASSFDKDTVTANVAGLTTAVFVGE